MAQKQAPKETPRTKDKLKTFAFRCSPAMHKQLHKSHRGSAWARDVLAQAMKSEDKT